MLPLGLPPDDLVGTCSELTQQQLDRVFERARKGEYDTESNVYDAREGGLRRNIKAFHEASAIDEQGEDNVQVSAPPVYHDLDASLQQELQEVALDIIWDRILYLRPTLNERVVQTSPSWHSAAAFLMDACTDTIIKNMECMSTYERTLAELANAQGRVPQMFESRVHRRCFREMIDTRIKLILDLIETARIASAALEDAWTIEPGPGSNDAPMGISGISIPFRKKWYAEQAFCLELQERQNETTPGPNEEGSSETRKHKANNELESTHQKQPLLGHRKWVETIDFLAEDLLTALLDLGKRVEKGRIEEIKEEHSFQCIKTLGVLASVGKDIFAPLVVDAARDNSSSPSTSFRLEDETIRAQCHALWTQIQEHKMQQERQQFLNEEGPTSEEQKRAVADMTRASIRMLRILRKCVTDKHEPSNAPPLMPLALVSKLAKSSGGSPSSDYMNLDVVDSSYAGLIKGAFVNEGRQHCMGGCGQRRFSSLILALFFRKLSERCSEWHAELAEQELLTAMSSEDLGLDGANGYAGSVNGDNTAAVGTGAEQSSKPGKKSKKKRAKKATVVTEPTQELEKSSTQTGSDQKPTENGTLSSSQATSAPIANGVSSAGDNMNGHQAGPVTSDTERNPKATKSSGKAKDTVRAAPISGTVDDGAGAAQASEKGAKAKALGTATAARDKKELSTYHVDKKVGVADKSGGFQTAESYLVGRLTALLSVAQNPRRASQGNAKGKASVVII